MSRYSILIIEDDPAVAESPRAGLTREGFAVNSVSPGTQGIEHPGSGLGLAIIRAIAVAQGGGVDVQSASEGKGSRFAFRLPPVPSQQS